MKPFDLEAAKRGERLEAANQRVRDAAPAMLEALQNLENDAGQIPEHAWKLCQDAIELATGERK